MSDPLIPPLTGWLVLDKPDNMTSARLVGRVKHIIKKEYGKKIKVGHTGTLDPFATGVLPIIIGEATKLASYNVNAQKGYIADIKWGDFYDTGDFTGNIIKTSDICPTKEQVAGILKAFTGKISQRPHSFSAIKVDGQRSYDRARAGEIFELPARDVTIYALNIVSHCDDARITRINVICSKGTYIRVLAEDMAKSLGACGTLVALRRSQVGPFYLKMSVTLDKVEESLYKHIISSEQVLDGITALDVQEGEMKDIYFGRTITTTIISDPLEDVFLRYQGKIFAIANVHSGIVQPKRILNIFN